jgi:molybdate transport system substrate-binding protein
MTTDTTSDSQPRLRLLGGGAAHGLVSALAPVFEDAEGLAVAGDFGAVGGMRKRIMEGERPDMAILTSAILDELGERGLVDPASITPIGGVPTSVAVRTGDAAPNIATAEALRAALLAADGIFFPDPELATAGIHFRSVLVALGIHDDVKDQLHTFPNGATAMRALAASAMARPIGCTQATEIISTPGLTLLGDLPAPHDLTTVYVAGVMAESVRAAAARRFIARLSGADGASVRRICGFVG